MQQLQRPPNWPRECQFLVLFALADGGIFRFGRAEARSRVLSFLGRLCCQTVIGPGLQAWPWMTPGHDLLMLTVLKYIHESCVNCMEFLISYVEVGLCRIPSSLARRSCMKGAPVSGILASYNFIM